MSKVPAARILVIDDNAGVANLLAASLGEDGHTVSSALTGDEGLELVTRFQPDLVLLDVLLPGMNGIDVLKRIRAIDPRAKVIMLTGNIDPSDVQKAFELGALAYIDKPFDFAHLKRVVAAALRAGV